MTNTNTTGAAMKDHQLSVLIVLQRENETIVRRPRGQYGLTNGTRVYAPTVRELLGMGVLVGGAGSVVLNPTMDHPDYRNVWPGTS